VGYRKFSIVVVALRAILECRELYHVSQKTAPFYFCNNFVKSRSFLIIFGKHIPQ